MVESQNIYFSKKTLQVAKVIGFSPVTIHGEKSSTSCYDVFFFVSNVLFGFFILGLSIVKRAELMTSDSVILSYGTILSLVSTVGIAITLMINSFICRHRLWKTVLIVEGIDKKVRPPRKLAFISNESLIHF